MNSHRTQDFRNQLAALPESVQRQAAQAYRLFQQDPWHSSLRFKCIHRTKDIYSVRIGRKYRAIGKKEDEDGVTWFWIGTHADYDRLLKQLS